MFTGIIEEIGIVAGVRRATSSVKLRIRAQKVLEGTRVGDSIAVNGVCLTVASLEDGAFCADVMPRTLESSSLGSLGANGRVNLERAIRLGDRLGGHIVTGHIDGTGRIVSIVPNDNARLVRIEASGEILRYVVERGSIAIDGMSLTVAALDERSLTVSLIPHTFANTTMSSRKTGDIVNLECDIIGKYAERAALAFTKDATDPAPAAGALTLETLIENGF